MRTQTWRGGPGSTTDDGISGPPQPPVAVVLVLTFLGCLALSAVFAELETPEPASLAILVTVVAVASWHCTPISSLGVAAVVMLFVVGFLEENAGNLVWHGDGDVLRLSILVVVAFLAATARTVRAMLR